MYYREVICQTCRVMIKAGKGYKQYAIMTNMKFPCVALKSLCVLVLVVVTGFFGLAQTSAQNQKVTELQNSISQKSQERAGLEAQADQIRAELAEISSEKNSISKEISVINAERKGLENQLAQTQNSIDTIDLEIQESENLIQTHNKNIDVHVETIQKNLRTLHAEQNLSYLEFLLSSKNISDFFKKSDDAHRFQIPLWKATDRLIETKRQLRIESEELALEQDVLLVEQEKLDDQKSIVAEQEQAKQFVFDQTETKEIEYQKNLIQTLANIATLQAEIRDFESKLDFALNPNTLPEKGSQILAWPLDRVFITQRFGKTVSSERLYVSGSHSGADFGASTGTPVYAVADGIVKGVGNTDDTCWRTSFGKWVFIEHDDIGLSTTYGHLSKWKVEEGQRVKKGDIIAYSGNTGHSTGPHLHLTVYATKGVDGQEGVRITNRASTTCPGNTYRMPLAPTAAYLDPLAYLPATTPEMFKHR